MPVTPHQIIAVVVRLFAVWLAATAVVSAPTMYAEFLEHEFSRGSSMALVALMGLVALGIVLFLWRFPLSVAGKLLSPSAKQPEESASPDLWLAMGCSILGLWLITLHVPNMVMLVAFGGWNEWGAAIWVPDVVGITLGLWLAFGGRGFRGLFWMARNAGYRQPPTDRAD